MPLKAGYLVKRGRVARTWKKRWFVLYEDKLVYFADHSTIERKGVIALQPSSTCYPQLESQSRFAVTTGGRELLLQAGADRERIEWLSAICECVAAGAAALAPYAHCQRRAIASHRVSAAASAADAVLAQFSGTLTARVICATNLTAKDPGGTSDPFCLLRLRGGCHRTPVIPKTLEPSWDDDPLATATLPFHRTDSFLAIEVWDHDFGTTDDFLGRAVVPLAAVGTQPMRRWCSLGKRSRKSHVSGAILIELYTSVPRDLHFWSEYRRVFSAGGFALPTAVAISGTGLGGGRASDASEQGKQEQEEEEEEDSLALAIRAYGGGAASAAEVHAARFQASGSGLAWMLGFATEPESAPSFGPAAAAAAAGAADSWPIDNNGRAMVPLMRSVSVVVSEGAPAAEAASTDPQPDASLSAPPGVREGEGSRPQAVGAGTLSTLDLASAAGTGGGDSSSSSSAATASEPHCGDRRDTAAPEGSGSATAWTAENASLEARGTVAQQTRRRGSALEGVGDGDSQPRPRWGSIQQVGRRALQTFAGRPQELEAGRREEEGSWNEAELPSGDGDVSTSPWATRRALQQSPQALPDSLGHFNDVVLRRLRGLEGASSLPWTPSSVSMAVEIPEDRAVVVLRSHPGREALLARGRLWLTNLRLVFEADGAADRGGGRFTPHLSTVVPLASVHGITLGREAVGRGGRQADALVVQCADVRTLTFVFVNEAPSARGNRSTGAGSSGGTSGVSEEGSKGGDGGADSVGTGLSDEDDDSGSESGMGGDPAVMVATALDAVAEATGPLSFKGLQPIGEEEEGQDMLTLHGSDSAVASSWTSPAKRFLLRVQHRMLNVENDAALHYSLMHAPLLKAVPSAGPRSLAQSRAERNGWRFSPQRELERFGLPNAQWRISPLNDDYALCGTYPRVLGVPAAIGDEVVAGSAKYRSKGRFPALSWLDRTSGAAIVRCAQPLRGIQGAASGGDQELVDSIRRASAMKARSKGSQRQSPIVFVDCRPRINALGNQAVGKGFEDTRMYTSSSIVFLGIENIHVMRTSLAHLRAALLTQSDPRRASMDAEASGWLLHVSSVLTGAVRVARLVHLRGIPCVVHCSDGWDRTPQVTATAQLLLDPHFRTSAGFVELIHKEFICFGHKVAERCGFRAHGPDSHDFSPILLQWLDCVHQAVAQCPSAFEFTPAFLATVADLLFSGFVGESLCDSERERDQRSVRETTLSLARLCDSLGPACLNAAYAPVESMLTVDASPVSMRLWREWFLRWDLRTRAVALYSERQHVTRRARRGHLGDEEDDAHVDPEGAGPATGGGPKHSSTASVSAVAWVPDHVSTHCSECHLPFSFMRRRRHCGVCGQAFCKACSRNRVPLPGPGNRSKMRRVCGDCFAELEGT